MSNPFKIFDSSEPLCVKCRRSLIVRNSLNAITHIKCGFFDGDKGVTLKVDKCSKFVSHMQEEEDFQYSTLGYKMNVDYVEENGEVVPQVVWAKPGSGRFVTAKKLFGRTARKTRRRPNPITNLELPN